MHRPYSTSHSTMRMRATTTLAAGLLEYNSLQKRSQIPFHRLLDEPILRRGWKGIPPSSSTATVPDYFFFAYRDFESCSNGHCNSLGKRPGDFTYGLRLLLR
jgi:hypothetical protein